MSAAGGGPVVIVGAGPVGMTLALELARLEIRSVVLDRKPHLDRDGSRAIVVGGHTLRTFQRLGCAEPMLAKGVALRRARTYLGERELFCVDFPPPAPGEVPRFMNLQQTSTEAALLQRVSASPHVEVAWDSGVTGAFEEGGRAVLLVQDRTGLRALGAPYVVACDGAHSTVRKLLEIPFTGRSFADRFLIADVRAELAFGHERRFFFDPPFNRGRQVLVHPQPDAEWRIDWQVPDTVDAAAERADGRLERRIRQVIGDANYELTWLSAYRFHERIARRFRAGRFLLAGDAAHVVAPFGARGMNSGVEDARNLGWKLALVLRGEAPEALLDSYETERQAAARENIRVTSATMRFMAPPTRAHRALRDAILRGSVPVRGLRRYVNSGKLAEPAVYGTGPGLVGRVAPAGTVEEGGVGPGFTLGRVNGDGPERLVLVRPDGYVCAELEGSERPVVEAAVQRALRGAGAARPAVRGLRR
jgi:3-(3-hydroxy-phenyl)propionate hydroxylase